MGRVYTSQPAVQIPRRFTLASAKSSKAQLFSDCMAHAALPDSPPLFRICNPEVLIQDLQSYFIQGLASLQMLSWVGPLFRICNPEVLTADLHTLSSCASSITNAELGRSG